jgi:hypothetical protein
MTEALQDQADEYRSLLRVALQSHPGPLSQRLQTWWTAEQAIIAQEAADRAARRLQRIADLDIKINELTILRNSL